MLPKGTVREYIAIAGAHIWYAQCGMEAHGVPVLLLHGGEKNSNYFENLLW